MNECFDVNNLSIRQRIDLIKKRWNYYGWRRLFKYFFFQRILRINSHVPWLCHWSSEVLSVERIKCKDWNADPGYSIGSYIQAANGIEFGRNMMLGPGVKIVSANHDLNDYEKHLEAKPIKIGDNAWLGSNVVITAGVELGPHTVVAANAVVTKSFPEGNCVLAGVPAKIIKQLPDYKGKPSATIL